MTAANHDELVDRISSHLRQPVERIDTHAATILLSGGDAFKLKKPVRFSFLDFSTLPARRAALMAELDLNRRTAPMLYRDLVPVSVDGRLGQEGEDEPVDWALRMHRFDQFNRLDQVTERGELALDLVEALAIQIVAFHGKLSPLTGTDEGTPMVELVDGNRVDLELSVPTVFDRQAVTKLTSASQTELRQCEYLLERRRREGKVRHCHGDLHLANIVLIDGQPILFDCLEFDASFAIIDVLYDLAFLVMDLINRGLTDHAQHLLQIYIDRTNDDAGLALMPLFISVRAAVRAKIEGVAGQADAAHGYLDLAGVALRPRTPRLIAIGGRSGTGKSTLAARLAPGFGALPGAIMLRSDVIRKRMFNKEPTEKLPASAYSQDVSDRVFGLMAERAKTLLRAGYSVIADGVYGRAGERQCIADAAQNVDVPFVGIWLEAPEALLEDRVVRREHDASDADAAVVRLQRNIGGENIAWHRLDSAVEIENLGRQAKALIYED